ncbi:hypothetical protein ACFOWX_01485 [Sphingorhabdus arenilitoris]|uniref:Uncharacterized protein n=1 Tax=Sphingorhabdus arenilitoris TaxID=1490041 RepID=A0ABV8RDX6_9SPHN
MDPISQADRFVILLRQQLAERLRGQKADSVKKVRNRTRQEGQIGPVSAAVARSGGDDRQLRRIIIEQLLTERFGRNLVNEAGFQAVLDQVVEQMESDQEMMALFGNIVSEVRRGV